jgi:hypothetical protein
LLSAPRAMREQCKNTALRASGIARRRTEKERAEAFFLCERRRRRRIQSAMREQCKISTASVGNRAPPHGARLARRCPGRSSERTRSFVCERVRKAAATERQLQRAERVMHKERAEAFFLCERRRRQRILDVRAADLQEEMTEQRFSVPSDPTKTAATKRTSQRAKRAVKHSAMREQCKTQHHQPGKCVRFSMKNR